jgi:hypothetical protein
MDGMGGKWCFTARYHRTGSFDQLTPPLSFARHLPYNPHQGNRSCRKIDVIDGLDEPRVSQEARIRSGLFCEVRYCIGSGSRLLMTIRPTDR